MIIKSIKRIYRRHFDTSPSVQRGIITRPAGHLSPEEGAITLVIVVGPHFNQNVPTAMMTFRMGYANAFEELGIPYLIIDQQDLADSLRELGNPFCMVNGSDFLYMDRRTVHALRNTPHSVWVDPWFKGSNGFFTKNGLDPGLWAWSTEHRKMILKSEPAFVHTATVPGGLCFFAEWESHGMKLVSLPLACDTRLYRPEAPDIGEFSGIKMAFVGGYWETKGKQLDRYLRPFEDELVIYGYSPWPYRGYRGPLLREAEPSLYRHSLLSPVINEPSVAILHGQINERIFKVLGSGGVPLVDAVPAYRELFTEDELFIPRNEQEFYDMAKQLILDEDMRQRSRRGRAAVLARHTYLNRARQVLDELGLSHLVPKSSGSRCHHGAGVEGSH